MTRLPRRSIWIAAACAAGLAALCWWMLRPGGTDGPGASRTPEAPPVTFSGAAAPGPAALASGPTPETRGPAPAPKAGPPGQPRPAPDLARELDGLLEALRRGISREEARARFRAIKELVHALPPDAAARAILDLLESGRDAPTGLEFIVGSEGTLEEAPTLRVALLDWLAQTDPAPALAFSLELLPAMAHPDEHAMVLRNLAWLDPRRELDGLIAAGFAAMLDRRDWLASPSAGFLEAFDVAVAIGGRDMWMQLGSVLRMETAAGDTPDHPANRAAFIALDRLMLREPETLVHLLQEQPGWLDWAPRHRVSLLTRLDVRSGPQLRYLRDYLLSAAHAPGELEYFAEVFPNVNRFSGDRLVTSWEGMQSAAEIDLATLEQVSRWSADSAFAAAAPHLLAITRRLEAFYPR